MVDKSRYMKSIARVEAEMEQVKEDFDLLENPTIADMEMRDDLIECLLHFRDRLHEEVKKLQ